MTETDRQADLTAATRYRSLLTDFQEGRLQPEEFAAERLQFGVFVQNRSDSYMVQMKLCGGRFRPPQLESSATALERWSKQETLHITPRQQVQFHHVSLTDTPDLLDLLTRNGFVTSGTGSASCNVSTCPLAGACPNELVDIEPYADIIADHFLQHTSRRTPAGKTEIALSGCALDCAFGRVHDLAFIAARQNQTAGFRVLAGGGSDLRRQPAIVLEPFIEETDLLPVIEAVLGLHDRHGDPSAERRFRLRDLISRWGPERFRRQYRIELERVRPLFDRTELPVGQWRPGAAGKRIWGDENPWHLGSVVPMAWSDGLVIPLDLPDGGLNRDQLEGLADIAKEQDQVRIRATQTRNLVLLGTPPDRCDVILKRLRRLGLRVPHSAQGVRPNLRALATPADTGSRGETPWPREQDAERIPLRIIDLTVEPSGRRQFRDSGRSASPPEHRRNLDNRDHQIPPVPSTIQHIRESFLRRQDQGENFHTWSRREGEDYFQRLMDDLIQSRESCSRRPPSHRDMPPPGSINDLLNRAEISQQQARDFLGADQPDRAGQSLHDQLQLGARALLTALEGRTVEQRGDDSPTCHALYSRLLTGDEALAEDYLKLEQELRRLQEHPEIQRCTMLADAVESWIATVRLRCRVLVPGPSKGSPPSSPDTP